jgi:hypothetical protein
MPKFQKHFGEFPENVRVAGELVEFDEGGVADVSDAVAEVLTELSHEYRALEAPEEPSEDGDDQTKDDESDQQEDEAGYSPVAPEEAAAEPEVEPAAAEPAAEPAAEVVAPAAPKRTAPARPAAKR